ncbi:MAG: peptidylprolyl isomerase [Paracoccus sp. (in: a-proteobacteria)]
MDARPLLPPVIVNGITIPAERIADEAQNHPAPKGKPGQAWKAAARALALREVLLQEAAARGITPAPIEIGEGLWETDEEALIRQLLDEAIETPAPRDVAVLRAHYDAHPERFHGPSLFEAAHILIPAAPDQEGETSDDARNKARARAQALCDMLARDPGAFKRLAGEHSACSSRENGGLLGQLASGDTVSEFEAALLEMPEGTISAQPVESHYGFHVIRLDARAPGGLLPFEAVLPQLRIAEEKAGWVRASRDFAAALLARAEVSGITLDPAAAA